MRGTNGWRRSRKGAGGGHPSRPAMVGMDISNAIFCTEFDIALQSKLNELKWHVKCGICISSDKCIAIQTSGFARTVIRARVYKKIVMVFVLFAIATIV